MVKSITHNLNYYLSIGNNLEVRSYLLKLPTRKHGNSIYFTCDNMVCFPKFGHNSYPHTMSPMPRLKWSAFLKGGFAAL